MILVLLTKNVYGEHFTKNSPFAQIVTMCLSLPLYFTTLFHSLPKTICFADFQPSNILSRNDRDVYGLIDFGSIRTRPKVSDIGYALKALASEDGDFDERKIGLFLYEIEKDEPLSKEEKLLLYPFIVQDVTVELGWYLRRLCYGHFLSGLGMLIDKRIRFAEWLRYNRDLFYSI